MIDQLKITESKIEILSTIEIIQNLLSEMIAKDRKGSKWYVTLEGKIEGLKTAYNTLKELEEITKRTSTLNFDLNLSNMVLGTDRAKLLQTIDELKKGL